jgi:predicted ABC-type transport system involved in lysophospholipase L1 biosynthesis ATPase subunit
VVCGFERIVRLCISVYLGSTENGDRAMDTLFQAQKDSRTAVVIVTHDSRVAARAGRTLVMTDGRFTNSYGAP